MVIPYRRYLFYDKIMPYKENYTLEDTKNNKTQTLIYIYVLSGKFKP